MNARVAAVICAAGSSRRFGAGKKEYACLGPSYLDDAGKPLTVLGAATESFAACPVVGPLVITVPPEDEDGADKAGACLPVRLLDQGRVFFTPGGTSRRESVYKALLFLKNFDVDFVLIHDGARPWVSKVLIERVIEAMLRYKAAIPVVPALETPKLFEGNPFNSQRIVSFIQRHLRRSELGFAQTPQGFAFPEILLAHEKAALREKEEAFEYTDDAEVWGEFIGPVAAVLGEAENRKITFPEDLSL